MANRSKQGKSNPNQFQLPGFDAFNIPNLDVDMNFDDDKLDINDDELERELMAIESNSHPRLNKVSNQKKAPSVPVAPPKKPLVDLNAINLDNLLNDDDDVELDEDDEADLEGELNDLACIDRVQTVVPVALIASTVNKNDSKLKGLEDNLNMFKKKMNDAAKVNDSSKQRRFKRTCDQYEEAIRAYKNGKSFNFEELPVAPELADSKSTEPAEAVQEAPAVIKPRPAPLPPKQQPPLVEQKQQEPPPLPPFPTRTTPTVVVSAQPIVKNVPSAAVEDDQSSIDAPKTTIDALNLLQTEFQRRLTQAQEIEDSAKKRRYQRLVKQVEDAIKATKLGKPYDYEELSQIVPPGFSPIPLQNGKPVTLQSLQQPIQTAQNVQARPQQKPVTPTTQPPQSKKSSLPSKQNEIVKELRERQRLFKEAALEAKKRGDDKVALIYLKNSKGFDQMIVAGENGLPVDMTNLPKPPQLINARRSGEVSRLESNDSSNDNQESDWEFIQPETGGADRNEIFKQLEKDLNSQLKVATANSQYFKKIGDVANANKFLNYESETLKDLNGLRNAISHGDDVPRYHYEKRKYQVVQNNLNLTENDFELEIIRAINLPIPNGFDVKTMQTYVKFELPIPIETPQSDKTSKQVGNCPEYNQSFKLQIQRKQNKTTRLINRKELKIEIYYKAGLLKGDKLLATANVKLQPLEEKCTIHEAFDLFEGRKQLSGKIELKIRVFEPYLHKEIKTLEEKWLIIDKWSTQKYKSSIVSQSNKESNDTISKLIHAIRVNVNIDDTSQDTQVNYFDGLKDVYSLEILNFDYKLIEGQIASYRTRLGPAEILELSERGEHLKQIIESLKDKLRSGGHAAFKAYLNDIQVLPQKYDDLAKQCELKSDFNKMALHRRRKELVEAEIQKLISRLNV